MSGEHAPGCSRICPQCLCATCQHDHDPCCDDHADAVNDGKDPACPVAKCPDYLKEEETNDAL